MVQTVKIKPKILYPEDLYQQVLENLYQKKKAKIIQIGTCDGKINDPIYKLIKDKIKIEKLILIEPQEKLNDTIKKNYSFMNNFFIENVAIGYPGEFNLYKLKEKYYDYYTQTYLKNHSKDRVLSGFVSSDINHVKKHLLGKLKKDINLDEAIMNFKVQFIKLSDLIIKHSFEKYDVLQIDAEGKDDEVLQNCDIQNFKPQIINFEYIHLDKQRRINIFNFLSKNGYTLHIYSKSDILCTQDLNIVMSVN